MLADDPRHGTEAGNEQHWRDNEDACAPCHDAKILASRRRSKRKAMGAVYLVELDKMHRRLVDWRAAGASYGDIAEHVGMEESRVWELVQAGPEMQVYVRTFERLAKAPATYPVTPIGITRRLRALAWLGYSVQQVATVANVHTDTILDARACERDFVARKVRDGIVRAYDSLHMVVPSGVTQQERAGISRVRNASRRAGWLPPLAWKHIDDRRERPRNWEYTPASRSEQFAELLDRGDGLSEVCRHLHLSESALEKWCERQRRGADFTVLRDRDRGEPGQRNQHSEREAS